MECGFDNITACFIEALADWLKDIINAPLHLFLSFIERILVLPPNTDAFAHLWAVVVTIISIFYGILIIASGVNFIVSGANPTRREYAKQWLQNILLMIVFVQASYFLYGLAAQIANGLAGGFYQMIDPSLFEVQLNITDLSLLIPMGGFYLIVLFLTSTLLSATYTLTSIGVVFCPIGIMFYFIPPLKDLGKLILSSLGLILSLPMFASIILVAGSLLSQVRPYDSFHLILSISSFLMIDIMLILLLILAIVRSVMSLIRLDVVKSIIFFKIGVLGKK